jgi:hypothetical protein
MSDQPEQVGGADESAPGMGSLEKLVDVFISHSTKDRNMALAITHGLEARGIRCWMAPRDITPGTDWDVAIIGAIKSCRVMVLVFSGHSNSSPQVANEVRNALANTVSVIPFRIEDAPLSEVLQYHIRAAHWLDALTPPLDSRIEELADAIDRLLVNAGPRPPRPTPPAGGGAGSPPPKLASPFSKPMIRIAAGVVAVSIIGFAGMSAFQGSDRPEALTPPLAEVQLPNVEQLIANLEADIGESDRMVEEGEYLDADEILGAAIERVAATQREFPTIAARFDEIGGTLNDRRTRARTSCQAERSMSADLGTPPPTCPEGA